MEIVHKLQQSTSTRIGTCSSIVIDTCSGIGSGTCIDTGAGEHDVEYCLTTDGLVRFREMIYLQIVVRSRR